MFNCLFNIKMEYSMTDLVMSDLKRYLENIDEEFKARCNFATTMAHLVDVQPSVPWLA